MSSSAYVLFLVSGSGIWGREVDHEPSGLDFWSLVPGQGSDHGPEMIEMGKTRHESGYATDIITDKSLEWMQKRDQAKLFFLMCHHKAPHRSWECHPRHKTLYTEDVKVPKSSMTTITIERERRPRRR